MKRLNTEEITQMANALSMTEEMAKEVSDMFADIYEHEQKGKCGWKIGLPLESVDNYIKEWENHWHRETNWEEFYTCEKEEYFYCYDKAEEIFETLESFMNYVHDFDFAYELKCNGMIIVVC